MMHQTFSNQKQKHLITQVKTYLKNLWLKEKHLKLIFEILMLGPARNPAEENLPKAKTDPKPNQSSANAGAEKAKKIIEIKKKSRSNC